MNNGDKSKCIFYEGGINSSGYGVVWKNGKSEYAHRQAYKDYNGFIDESLVVMHSCDNKTCVNPNHLSQGTHNDNMKDMVSKNRQANGESHGRSKLTIVQVGEIRASNKTCRALGDLYGVHNTTISAIKKGDIWADALLKELDK